MATTDDGELVERAGSALELAAGFAGPANLLAVRAEVSEQIATAKAYPRDLTRVLANARKLATFSEQTALGCLYSLPRGGKRIEGPSVRLAEILASQWCNLRVRSQVIEATREYVLCRGSAIDLETNSGQEVDVRRRVVPKKGRQADEDDIQLTTAVALSLAYRNVVFRVVPKLFVIELADAAREVALGKAEAFADVRGRCLEAFAKMGVAKEQLLQRCDVPSEHDLTPDHVLTLRVLFKQIKDGETTLDEAFPPPPPTAAKPDLATKVMPPPPKPAAEAPPAPPPVAPPVAPPPAPPPPPPDRPGRGKGKAPAGTLPGAEPGENVDAIFH